MEKKHNIVYKTTNIKNGKFYVGLHSTDDINDGYLGSGTYFQVALKKYGIENFKKEILFDFSTRAKAAQIEGRILTHDFIKDINTYNLFPGSGVYIDANHNVKKRKLSQKLPKPQDLGPIYSKEFKIIIKEPDVVQDWFNLGVDIKKWEDYGIVKEVILKSEAFKDSVLKIQYILTCFILMDIPKIVENLNELINREKTNKFAGEALYKLQKRGFYLKMSFEKRNK